MKQKQDEKMKRVKDAAVIADAVWQRIDFDKVNASRNLDDEMTSRIATSAYTDDAASFMERLSSKFGVRQPKESQELIDVIERRNEDDEFLRTIREHSSLVTLKMKQRQGKLQ